MFWQRPPTLKRIRIDALSFALDLHEASARFSPETVVDTARVFEFYLKTGAVAPIPDEGRTS